jgi:hypothetical protein
MPFQKLDKVERTERPDRFVVSRPALCRHTPLAGHDRLIQGKKQYEQLKV